MSVRLGAETVTEDAQVSEDVRKEQIEEPDMDADLRRDNRRSLKPTWHRPGHCPRAVPGYIRPVSAKTMIGSCL